MSVKSYVTMERKVCAVCLDDYDTGAILMDKRLREMFEMHTNTGLGMCDKCTKLRDDGYTALIVLRDSDHHADTAKIKDTMSLRTGMVIHVRDKMFGTVLDVPVPKNGIAFISKKLADSFKDMQDASLEHYANVKLKELHDNAESNNAS